MNPTEEHNELDEQGRRIFTVGNVLLVLAAWFCIWTVRRAWRFAFRYRVDVLEIAGPLALCIGVPIAVTLVISVFWIMWRKTLGPPDDLGSDWLTARDTKTVVVTFLLVLGWFLLSIPGFLEARLRAKVSRARQSMRDIGQALTAYQTDHGAFPPAAMGANSVNAARFEHPDLQRLPSFRIARGPAPASKAETPRVAGIGVYRADPFAPEANATFGYYTAEKAKAAGWILVSPGPDGYYDVNPAAVYDPSVPQPSALLSDLSYDPTNGTFSAGDIWRVAP